MLEKGTRKPTELEVSKARAVQINDRRGIRSFRFQPQLEVASPLTRIGLSVVPFRHELFHDFFGLVITCFKDRVAVKMYFDICVILRG